MKNLLPAALCITLLAIPAHAAPTVPDPATMPEIKAYCLDFNWQGSGRRKKIADPPFMKDAGPQAVVDRHKAIGSNVIQTFCISHNGYAWYRNDVTPEVPGLKHDFLREVDWLMAETGNNKHLEEIRDAVGKHTRLITCLAAWNNADPKVVIPDAMANGIGLYGFCQPSAKNGTIPLDKILTEPLTMLQGDQRNIGALARAYHGKSLDAVWNGETFVEPENPPSVQLRLPTRRRGNSDIGRISFDEKSATVETFSPHHNGEATLTRLAPAWPATKVRLYWRENQAANVTHIRITNGTLACEFPLEENAAITWGTTGNLLLGDKWAFKANPDGGRSELKTASVRKTPEFIEIDLPAAFFEGNPEAVAYEWLK